MATAQGPLVGYNTGCSRRPPPGSGTAPAAPWWVVECAALSVVDVETGQRWRSVDGHGWTVPMPISPDGRWHSYVRRPRPSGPVELSVTGPDGRPVRLTSAAHFSQEWPNNRFSAWPLLTGPAPAPWCWRPTRSGPGAPWRLARWRMDPAGPVRLPLRADDLMADSGGPGSSWTVTALAVT